MAPSDKTPSTALSAGLIILRLLEGIDDCPVVPVYAAIPDVIPDGATIAFRRTSTITTAVKAGAPADEVSVDIWIYHPDYLGSIALAERVRAAIDGRSGRLGSLRLRSASLIDASEDYSNEKFLQILTFKLKINPC